jgi:hypothetical protein
MQLKEDGMRRIIASALVIRDSFMEAFEKWPSHSQMPKLQSSNVRKLLQVGNS